MRRARAHLGLLHLWRRGSRERTIFSQGSHLLLCIVFMGGTSLWFASHCGFQSLPSASRVLGRKRRRRGGAKSTERACVSEQLPSFDAWDDGWQEECYSGYCELFSMKEHKWQSQGKDTAKPILHCSGGEFFEFWHNEEMIVCLFFRRRHPRSRRLWVRTSAFVVT